MPKLYQWISSTKLLFLFLIQIIPSIIRQKQWDFATVSYRKSLDKPTVPLIVLKAFEANKLSGCHHALLYEPAFTPKKINNMIVAFYETLHTDLYWGDFVMDEDNFYQESMGEVIKKSLTMAQANKHICAFIDVNQNMVKTIETLNIPLKKFYIGDEWITDLPGFNVEGRPGRGFRNALYCAKRRKFRMEEMLDFSDLRKNNQFQINNGQM